MGEILNQPFHILLFLAGILLILLALNIPIPIIRRDPVKELPKNTSNRLFILGPLLIVISLVFFFFKPAGKLVPNTRDISTFLTERTYYPVSIALLKKRETTFLGGKIIAVSAAAQTFYNLPEDKLSGMSLSDLAKRLRPWMKKKDYKNFITDQARIAIEYGQGGLVFSNAPIIFAKEGDPEDLHPNPLFRGKTFLPIVVGLWGREIKGKTESENFTILYFDLTNLEESLGDSESTNPKNSQ